tara:strand:+ start:397 stop:852 length:456 start_codon:yes stop_codon:yes gene_type:complete
MNNITTNIKILYSQKKYFIITLISAFLIGYVMFYFTHFENMKGNLGSSFAYTQLTTQIIISGLFGINMAALWYKLKLSSLVKEKTSTSLAAVFSVIVSGCPACGITLASYLGLASFFSALPFFGLELKIVAILLLLYSTNSLIKNLNNCKI